MTQSAMWLTVYANASARTRVQETRQWPRAPKTHNISDAESQLEKIRLEGATLMIVLKSVYLLLFAKV